MKRLSAALCKAILALALALMCGIVAGCAKSSGPEIEWERTFGGLEGGWILEESDGGYWIQCGTRVLLLSDDGWLQLDRTLDMVASSSTQPTSDGGYIGADSNALIKIDASGSIEWKTEPVDHHIWLVEQTADGGYILAGHTGYTGWYKTSWCTQVIWLAKTDCSGALQWERAIGNDGTCDESPQLVQQTLDGGYIILACHGGGWGFSPICALLIKTDTDGEVVWQKTFEGGHLQCIQQTPDGGYVMAGTRWTVPGMNGRGWLVKISSTGDTEWDRTFAKGILHSVQLTSDGGYVMAGSKTTGKYADNPLGSLPWLMKADPGGEVQWQKTFGCQERDRWDSVSSVQQTSDGGYIVVASKECGTADYFGAQLWLIKMKSD